MTASKDKKTPLSDIKADERSLRLLYQISKDLNRTYSKDQTLQIIVQPALEADADSAYLAYVKDDETGKPAHVEVVAAWQREGEPQIAVGASYDLPDYPQTEPIVISDVDAASEGTKTLLSEAGGHTALILPLAYDDHPNGYIYISWNQPHTFSEPETALYREIADLAAPVVHSRRLAAALEKELKETIFYRTMVENSIEAITMGDTTRTFTYANRAAHELYGYDYTKHEMVGMPVSTIWPPGSDAFLRDVIFPATLKGGWFGGAKLRRKDGSSFDAYMTVFVSKDEDGKPLGTVALARDITEQKQAEAERERLQQEVIDAQRAALRELSSPIIPVIEGIIILPLIGSIDTARAREIMRSLLHGITQHRARQVIIDITGVPMVDSGVANHLNKAIQAARLKGANTIITGMSDAVAETVVDLGIDWGDVTTLSSLQTGLSVAIQAT